MFIVKSIMYDVIVDDENGFEIPEPEEPNSLALVLIIAVVAVAAVVATLLIRRALKKRK